jgi:uncharacterized FAD-dependent dehydrogenase
MILINNVFLPLDTDFSSTDILVARYLKISKKEINKSFLYKKSVDARKKDNILFCCSFVAELSENNEKLIISKNKNVSIFIKNNYIWKKTCRIRKRPVVIGFGPAGMFSALLLARSGLNPIVIERGEDADSRKVSVESFFNGGVLNPESNVQFGEGGAGTFSDGKLNTGIKDFRCRTVLETFVEFGAPEKILYEAKPHIGTDILIDVVKNIRNEIIDLGGEVRFNCKAVGFTFTDALSSVKLSDDTEILTDDVILATGHSARDIYKYLNENLVEMCKKPFAIGVRIEHLQKDIDEALYGKFSDHPALEPASYKLAVHLNDGRGVFTFCMCPGGEVINSSSEFGYLAVNGMSYSRRDGINANSALLVSVLPEDFPGDDVLAGCCLQYEIEKKAYDIANGKIPVTTVGNLLYGEPAEFTDVIPTVKPQTVFANLNDIFPDFIVQSLKNGLPLLDKKIKGFAKPSSVITAPETRSSAPVRILRDENMQSVSIKGLYPCGEGAGYAGGIMSAAVDGLLCAEKIIEKYR